MHAASDMATKKALLAKACEGTDGFKVRTCTRCARVGPGRIVRRAPIRVPAERRYLRAMAELGPGQHRSGDIAEKLDRKVTALAPLRSKLIGKGMIWSRHTAIRRLPCRCSTNTCVASTPRRLAKHKLSKRQSIH